MNRRFLPLLSEKTSLLEEKRALEDSITRILLIHYKLSTVWELLQLLLFREPTGNHYSLIFRMDIPLLNKRLKKERLLEKSYNEIREEVLKVSPLPLDQERAMRIIPFLEELDLYPRLITPFCLLRICPKRIFTNYHHKFSSHEMHQELGYYLKTIRAANCSRYMELCARYNWLESELGVYEEETKNRTISAKLNRSGIYE